MGNVGDRRMFRRLNGWGLATGSLITHTQHEFKSLSCGRAGRQVISTAPLLPRICINFFLAARLPNNDWRYYKCSTENIPRKVRLTPRSEERGQKKINPLLGKCQNGVMIFIRWKSETGFTLERLNKGLICIWFWREARRNPRGLLSRWLYLHHADDPKNTEHISSSPLSGDEMERKCQVVTACKPKPSKSRTHWAKVILFSAVMLRNKKVKIGWMELLIWSFDSMTISKWQ